MAVGISFGRKDEEGIETDIVVGASIYCTEEKMLELAMTLWMVAQR
jgi:hypothetical protein